MKKHTCTYTEVFIGCPRCSICLHPPKTSKYQPKPEDEKLRRGSRPEPS